MRLLLPITLSLALFGIATGCVSVSAHQNFKNIMQHQIGRLESDRYASINHYSERVVSRTELLNGNIEVKQRAGLWRKGQECHVFFEIDKTSRKIIGWRYEGSEQSCVIVP